jgi:tetratricopeptide (TPR) repeat protein
MKHFALTLAFLLTVAHNIYARQQDAGGMTMTAAEEKAAVIVPGLGEHHHAVSTRNAEAQRFFDQGLKYVFAFNHEEAVRSFRRAAELDPQLAMAHWGIALALGPNINLDVDPARERAAYEAVQKALSLAMKAPENERAYIEALAKRYSVDPKADLRKLAVDYKNAMGELVKRYPDDLDAATLYAESAMDLRPWKLWTADGKPAEGTTEIVGVLESVLRRKPDHPGAIHYYIHAVEASPNPERALAYAPKLKELMPAAGHIVHMPAHIYMRTGDYDAAARSNAEAAEADRAYMKSRGAEGLYLMMYYNHNLHFLAIAHDLGGRFAEAHKAAQQLEENTASHLQEIPMLEGFVITPTLVLAHFRRWDDILKMAEPAQTTAGTKSLRHWARAMAYVAAGKAGNAEVERKAFLEARKTIAADAAWGLNSTSAIFELAEKVLDARIAFARKDSKTAVELLQAAVRLQDAFAYDEPPAWFLPARETLGGVLLQSGRAEEAEKVFRAELEKNARSGRALFGLMESLKAQGKDASARMVQKEFETAWKSADTRLRIEDL